MLPIDVRFERGRQSRKCSGQEDKPSGGLGGSVTTCRADKHAKKSSSATAKTVAERTRQMPVTFWTPDGTCHEGVSPRTEGQMLFIASDLDVSLGTVLTLRMTHQNGESLEWGLAEGTVVWRCPSEDLFRNKMGFGVCLHSRWPKRHETMDDDGPKEAA